MYLQAAKFAFCHARFWVRGKWGPRPGSLFNLAGHASIAGSFVPARHQEKISLPESGVVGVGATKRSSHLPVLLHGHECHHLNGPFGNRVSLRVFGSATPQMWPACGMLSGTRAGEMNVWQMNKTWDPLIEWETTGNIGLTIVDKSGCSDLMWCSDFQSELDLDTVWQHGTNL